jgi:hypothetical protein
VAIFSTLSKSKLSKPDYRTHKPVSIGAMGSLPHSIKMLLLSKEAFHITALIGATRMVLSTSQTPAYGGVSVSILKIKKIVK